MIEPARIQLDPGRIVGEISPHLFGGFAEHLGRCIYQGIYDPESPRADENGFRTDVLDALREMKISILRYPGGNFVSGYRWRDGVGPKDQRPVRRELAWRSLEPNTFGTNEFITYCRALDCEPMLGLNFGTATLQDTSDLVDYCNTPGGTFLSDLRKSHGHAAPHNVRYWCLGNEMDGPWQLGHMDAPSYAIRALQAAKIIKTHDPKNLLTICGSSNPDMPTYPEWDRICLETCWEHVDFLSMHDYATNWEDDTPSFLASGIRFESHINTIAATLRYVKAKLRSKHDVRIAWDEWNVWYKDRDGDGKWAYAPHLCEEVYDLQDALVVAQWLNTFLRHANVLKIACIAQIANVISPLLTTTNQLLKQTTFYSFVLFAQNARGLSLDVHTTSPRYSSRKYGNVPMIDASATFDPMQGSMSVFMVNRSTTEVLPVEIDCGSASIRRFENHYQLSGRDPKATNSFPEPDKVAARKLTSLDAKGGKARLLLPPLSFTVLSS